MIPNKLNYLNPYSFEYDDKGRITCIKNDKDEQHYRYDEKNRCVLHISNVSTKIYTYDDSDRIIGKKYYFGNKINSDTFRYTAHYKYISNYILTEYRHDDGIKEYEVYDKDGNPLNRYKISHDPKYTCVGQFKYNKDKTKWVYYEYTAASGYGSELSKVDSDHSRTIIPINQFSDNNYENHLKSILFVETIYFRIMGELDRILDDFINSHTHYTKDQFKDIIVFATYDKLKSLMINDNFNTVPILSFKNFPKYLDNLHEVIKSHLIQEIAKIMEEYPVTHVNEFIWSPNNNDELYCNDAFNIRIAGIKE